MKALTLTQPWSTLVALGVKNIETRSWSTPYRGRLAIHAAKGFPPDARLICRREPFKRVLMAAGIESLADLPRGVLLATVQLVDCVPTGKVRSQLSSEEYAFGDYSAGRWAWLLDDVQPLSEPVPACGALGLWDCSTLL
jgi:hypothetical protein